MLTFQHLAVVVVNDGSPCPDVIEVRDAVNGSGHREPGTTGDLVTYKLETYRNAVDCWLYNGDKVSAIDGTAFRDQYR